MKLLSQRDPLWAGDKLGSSRLTLGRWGWTTTCISMLSDYFGCYKSPLEIAKNVNNYTHDGLVLWWNLKFDKMKFVKRVRGNTTDLMPEIRRALKDPDRAAALQVNNQAHWVAAYSTKMFSRDLGVADPWMLPGKVVPVLKNYKNITGVAYFERTEILKHSKPKESPIWIPSKKLLMGKADNPDIFYCNGDKKFRFPNWFTFIEMGGNMKDVEYADQNLIDQIESGDDLIDIKPNS